MSAELQRADDALNEYLVEHSYRHMVAAKDEAEQRHWCARLTHYVAQRSPERIREMEVARGLRR